MSSSRNRCPLSGDMLWLRPDRAASVLNQKGPPWRTFSGAERRSQFIRPLQANGTSSTRLLDQREVDGRFLAVTTAFDVVGDLVVLIEALQARTLDSGDVNERILAAAFRRNKAEALGRVEEFYS